MSEPFVKITWKFKAKNAGYSVSTLEQMIGASTWAYTSKLKGNIRSVMASTLDEIGEWMRANAPWTDRTGKARASLGATMGKSWHIFEDGSETRMNDKTEIIVGYVKTPDPVFYAWYLETNYGGKYQIVLPTLDRWATEVFERVKMRVGLR